MSRAIAVCHGRFGRATLYQLNRPMARHAHREGHLAFHLSGPMAAIRVVDRACPLSSGDAVAVNPWEPHDFRPIDVEVGSLFLILYIKPLWFRGASLRGAPLLRFGSSRIEIDSVIRRLIDRVAALLLDLDPRDRFDGYLYDLTRACFEASWSGRAVARSPAPGLPFSDFRVRKSIRLMGERLGPEEIDLDVIARDSGLSRPHFYKLFRRQTGLTPNLYLNTLRMERAIDYLAGTVKSVTEIGYDLGFSSQSGFTRFFAANAGMPPTDYRRVARLIPT